MQVRVSEELHKRVRVYCAELGISISEYLRKLLEEGLDVSGDKSGVIEATPSE